MRCDTASTVSSENVGAYGFRLKGPLPPESLRVSGVAHWPVLQLEIAGNPVPAKNEYVMQRPEGAVCLDHRPAGSSIARYHRHSAAGPRPPGARRRGDSGGLGARRGRAARWGL